MPEVVLLCSVHKEHGRASSSELIRILERIEPEVMFQEIPYFEFVEKDPSRIKKILELRAIAKYMEHHNVRQLPVDTFDRSSFDDSKFDRVFDWMAQNSQDFRSLMDDIEILEYTRGFEYLNSRLNDSNHHRIDAIVTKALKELNDERLLMAYDDWNIHNSKRDDAMISNVYKFCRETNFNKGVFLFGSGHRQSLIKKIQLVKKTEKIRVNWKLAWGVSR
jgi:hypothetical protein